MQIIGCIFLFYLGFYFYRLAENHKKNRWAFAILGLVTFFFGYLMYILYYRIFIFEGVDNFTYSEISFKSFVSGFVLSFVVFQISNFIWNRKSRKNNTELDNIGKQ